MKKKLVLSILVLLMGSTLFITGNKKINQEITVEDLKNNKSIAIYVKDDNGNYNKATNIPTSGYTLNTTKSVCTNNAKPSWNVKTNSLKISNLTSNNIGCYLYFDELEGLKDIIKIAQPSSNSFTSPAATREGIFYTEDDWGTTYYYRGAVENNWFKFAGFYWRIIRINGDGSIRMIYNGNTTVETGISTEAVSSSYSNGDDDNAYMGYMYGATRSSTYAATHANTNDSKIKTIVDTWYRDNLLTNYDQYLSKEAGFCNDRKVTPIGDYIGNGTINTKTAYSPYSRFKEADGNSYSAQQSPTLKCEQIDDLFTTNTSTKGNKKLIYPVGLITADEVIYAGGFGGIGNDKYYLHTSSRYWTMTPAVFYSRNSVFLVLEYGNLESYHVANGYGVRPVINISPDVKLIGDGTTSNPYQIEGVE